MQLKFPFLIEPAPEPTPRARQILLGGRVVPYRFRRARRRTIGIAVDEHGLHAAAPRWATIGEVEGFMREKERWILKRLDEMAGRKRVPFVWAPGARLPYLGREIVLEVAPMKGARLEGDRLRVGTAAGVTLRAGTLEWLRASALAHYRERTAVLVQGIRLPHPEVGLSNAKTQWGSCTRRADGRARVLINWRLVHFELPLIDYVIAHELGHLAHMNHSAAFWRVVESIFPDYESARKALRHRGHMIPDL